MTWEARTNTRNMIPNAVFEILETPQGTGHVATTPPTGSPISVWLWLGGSPVPGQVLLSTDDDMFLDLRQPTLWHLRPWRQGDGPKVDYTHGFATQHWVVANEADEAQAKAIRDQIAGL